MNWQTILDRYNDKDIVFIGWEREGQSFKKFIEKLGKPRSFRFIDKKEDSDYLVNLQKTYIENQTVVFKTVGVPGRVVPVPYETPMDLFLEICQTVGCTTIGVTGTKGKSTTTALLAHILEVADMPVVFCGNIGKPVLDHVEELHKNSIVVIELGVYHTADVHRSPHIVAITNLHIDHIPYFGSLELYQEAKHRLLKWLGPDDYFVYNPLSAMLASWAAETPAKNIPIDTAKSVDFAKAKIYGEHNRLNAVMAESIAKIIGIDDTYIQKGIDTFVAPPHRLETITKINEVTYIDDAIGSAPEATVHGLRAVTEHIGPVSVLFLGGEDRSYDFTELAYTVESLQIPHIVLFPDTGDMVAELFTSDYQPELLRTTSMEEAVQWAAKVATPGSVVLLSTAAPSYSLWDGFEVKGKAFQDAIKTIRCLS